jgi:hypothetical protein
MDVPRHTILSTYLRLQTHTICNIITFPLQQWWHEHTSSYVIGALPVLSLVFVALLHCCTQYSIYAADV